MNSSPTLTKLIYRGHDGFGGFIRGQEYTLPVGQHEDGYQFVVHPASGEPWQLMPSIEFWQVWQKVKGN